MVRQVNSRSQDVSNLPRITQSETSLAHFGDFILYGFNDSNVPDNFSGFAYSNNLGETWHDGGNLPLQGRGATNDGDPVIAVDRNGIFYYGQLSTQVDGEPVVSVSTGVVTNGRITMNPPQTVGRGAGIVEGDQDKEWIAVGPDANNPGHEALYIAWTDFTVPSGTNLRFSKYAIGVTLNPIIQDQDIVVSNGTHNSGAFVVVDKQGVIYIFYEAIDAGGFNVVNQPNRQIRMTKSTDGGNTFPIDIPVSAKFSAASLVDLSPCDQPAIGTELDRQIRMNEFPHAAIGPDGTLYAVWNAGRFDGNRTFINVFLSYSRDGGNTWHEVRVTDTLTFPFFPTVAANHLGAHVQYNRFNEIDSVGGTGNGTFGIFMKTFSLESGLSPERVINNPHSQVPITNGINKEDPAVADCYMGDYNQIVTGPDGTLLHSWGDNRNILQGETNPDVFFEITHSASHCSSLSHRFSRSSSRLLLIALLAAALNQKRP